MNKIQNISEFQKLFKINIPYEPEFDYYIKTLCKSEEFMFKLPDLLKDFQQYERFVYNDWESPKKYKLDYALPKMVDYIKNSKAYTELQEWDASKLTFVPKKDGYKMQENDGRYFLSLDFTSANFSTLKFFDSKARNEFKDSWAELCDHLDIHPLLASSKSFRQIVFGNTNPKRIGKIQHYYIGKLKEIIDEHIPDTEYMFVSHDELIIRLKSEGDMAKITSLPNEVRGYENLINGITKSFDDFPVHSSVFKLDALAKGIYLKTQYMLMCSNPGVRGGFISLQNWYLSEMYKTLHGAPGNLFYQYFKKHVLEEEVEERDLLFQDNGRLCKWVIRKEDDHKRLDTPVEFEEENYYKIPKQLRKALPGITDEQIEKVIAIYQDTCKYCHEGDGSCQCWNDD